MSLIWPVVWVVFFVLRILGGLCLFNFFVVILWDGSLPWGLWGPPATQEALRRAGGITGSLLRSEPWRCLSAPWVHSSALHVGINLVILHSIGRKLQPRIGVFRVVVLVFFFAALGIVATSAFFSWSGPMQVGLDGALIGLLAVELMAKVARRERLRQEATLNELLMIGVLLFTNPAANFSHASAAVLGLLLGFLLGRGTHSSEEGAVYASAAKALLILATCAMLYARFQN